MVSLPETEEFWNLEILWKKQEHPPNPGTLEINERMLVKLPCVVFTRFLPLVLNGSSLMQFCKRALVFFLWKHRFGVWEVQFVSRETMKDLKEGDTVYSPTLLLEPALITKSDSPSKAHYPGRPKSLESHHVLCYPFKRSHHPEYEIIFDPCAWDKIRIFLLLSFERAETAVKSQHCLFPPSLSSDFLTAVTCTCTGCTGTYGGSILYWDGF